MLNLVSEKGIKVKINTFNGVEEVPKAVELAHSGKMQGKPVGLVDQEAIQKEKDDDCPGCNTAEWLQLEVCSGN